MQLDKTLIVIRERGMLETLDLSLQLIRVYLGPLVLALLLGAAPFVVFNFLAIGPLVPLNPEDYEWRELNQLHARYVWNLLALMTIEAPLISLFLTPYLGHAVFQEKPQLRQVVWEVTGMWHRLVWCVGFRRLVIPAMALALTLQPMDTRPEREVLLLGLMLSVVMLLRATRPYLLEIILLERNPLRGRGQSVVTIGRRNASLHNPSSAELFGRWLTAALFALSVGCAGFGTLLFFQGVLFNSWRLGPWMYLVALPLTVLMVIQLMTVFRFLSYLDLRIRQEGWEVELLLRAEGARMRDDLASGWT